MTRTPARRHVLRGLAGLAAAAFAETVLAQSHAGHHGSASAAKPKDPLATQFGGPFSLIDQTGRRRSDTDFRGRFMLVYFGFTRCIDTCPVDLPIIAQALDAIGPLADRVVPLFVTVDPANDTPDVIGRYLAAYHPRLIGLTGSEAEIAGVAKAYKVHRRKLTLPHHGAGDYAVDHGSLTYLMDREGRFLTLVPHDAGADRMAAVLRRYLA